MKGKGLVRGMVKTQMDDLSSWPRGDPGWTTEDNLVDQDTGDILAVSMGWGKVP